MVFGDVPVRDGATVVVARDGEQGLEVLLLRRPVGAAFVPGGQCFPGGAVDPEDGEGDAASLAAAVRETFEETNLRLDETALRLLARWVTPPGEPRRFDCRFYVAPAPAGQEPSITEEHDDWAWWRPADALAAAERGELFVIQPTLHTLATIGRFDSVEALLDALDAADPGDRVELAPNGWQVRLPFDTAPVG